MPTRTDLEELLNELLERPYDRAELERRIEETFSEQRAVMVLDMTGCSRTTLTFGIVPTLVMIHQLRLLSEGPVAEQGGALVKTEADNLFCLFDSVEDAVAAARAIQRLLTAVNLVLPKDLELYAAFGIGFGSILNLGNEDIWGNEVNLASKLGEDIANDGDVLLTAAAGAQLAAAEAAVEERQATVSGLELNYYALKT